MSKKLKLNQIIAISNGEKSRKEKILTKTYQNMSKEDLFMGISRRYAPLQDGGETLPDEDKKVQLTVKDAIKEVLEVCKAMYNVVASQDIANCVAKADVTVNGKTVLKAAPVTHLLFLEKQLVDLQTFVTSFPILDSAENWNWDSGSGCYRSEPKQTSRSKKNQKPLVLYPATPEHPAQTQLITEDETVGYWKTIKLSGAVSKDVKDSMLLRIRELSNAVKLAREEANAVESELSDFGDKIVDYVFAEVV